MLGIFLANNEMYCVGVKYEIKNGKLVVLDCSCRTYRGYK